MESTVLSTMVMEYRDKFNVRKVRQQKCSMFADTHGGNQEIVRVYSSEISSELRRFSW